MWNDKQFFVYELGVERFFYVIYVRWEKLTAECGNWGDLECWCRLLPLSKHVSQLDLFLYFFSFGLRIEKLDEKIAYLMP